MQKPFASRHLSLSRDAYVLLAPGLLIFAIFALLPLVKVVYLSFLDWDGMSQHAAFVGLRNYTDTLSRDPVFWTALSNTAIWTVLSLIIPPGIGFGLALSLNQRLPGKSIIRAMFYLPVVIAPIAVATMWRWIYDPFFGIISSLLTELGLRSFAADWLGNPHIALYSVFIAYVWQTTGFSLVLFLAGLQSVSQTLLEASRMDGAGRWQSFIAVTLPSLYSTITIVLVLSVINALRTFDIIYGMTHGGPGQSTQVLVLWAFWQSLQLHQYGKGSAIAVILLLLSFVIVIPYVCWLLKTEGKTSR